MGILILLTSSILAFAVSSKYYENYPMYLPAGESADIQLTLQNLASAEDVSVRAVIREGDGIIEMTDSSNEYLIPAGGKIPVNIKVTIPNDAKLQDAYTVNIQFVSITSTESGTAGLASGIDKEFNVIVGTGAVSEKKMGFLILKKVLMTLGIILVIIILIRLFRRRKTSNKKKK